MKALPALLLLSAAVCAQDAPIPLTVEYVGSLKSDRGRDFVAFLRSNFTKVDTTNARSITSAKDAAAAFANADVLVVDANLAGRLPAGYGKPMVVISGSGVRTAGSLGAKLDWL